MIQQKKQNQFSYQASQQFKPKQNAGFIVKKFNYPSLEQVYGVKPKTKNQIKPNKNIPPDIFVNLQDKKQSVNGNIQFPQKEKFSLKNKEDKRPTIMDYYVIRHREGKGQHFCQQHRKPYLNSALDAESQSKRIMKLADKKNRYFSESKIQKSRKEFPKKLKPIKLNSYQKPQFFDVNVRRSFSEDKYKTYRQYLTQSQTEKITEKLSKPKCNQCSKKTCECHGLNNQYMMLRNKLNYRFKTPEHTNAESQKQFKAFQARKKLTVNLGKLDKELNRSNQTVQDEKNHSSLRKIIKQKKTCRRNLKLRPINVEKERHKTFDVQVDSSRILQCSRRRFKSHKTSENDFTEKFEPISSEEESFIKGIVNSDKEKINQKREVYEVEKQQPQKVQMQIQTQDILIVRKQEGQNEQNGQNEEGDKQLRKGEQKQLSKCKKQEEKIEEKSFGQISYNVSKEAQRQLEGKATLSLQQINEISFTFAKIQDTTIKKQQEIKSSSFRKQDHQQQRQIDKVSNNKNEHKRNQLSLHTQVINQRFIIEGEKEDVLQKITEEPKLKIQLLQNIPINLSTTKPNQNSRQNTSQKNNQSFQQDKRCSRYKQVNSSVSGKKTVNMFNQLQKLNLSRGYNSSKRNIKKPFPNPQNQEQIFSFIKNYKPQNPSIVVQQLVNLENFQVLSQIDRLYFGEVRAIQKTAQFSVPINPIRQGKGVEITLHQAFQGQFQNNQRICGTLILKDGTYEGAFKNNLRHGQGIFKWRNGQVYEGQWKMGTKNGIGKWKSPKGSFYQGQWVLNMQHGKGKFVYALSTYVGEFRNFLKHGTGEQNFNNGDRFSGQYREGKPNGHGKYVWADGTQYEGDFLNGNRHGWGKWHESPSMYYEGQFQNDLKHGQGTQYYKDGSYLEGLYLNGSAVKGKLFNSKKQLVQEF